MREFYQWRRLMVMACIRRIVRDFSNAEEVLQDVYRQVWTDAGNYHPERGTPSAWLFMIARSRALDTLRKSQNNRSVLIREEDHRFTAIQGEEAHVRSNQFAQVRQKVHGLPEPLRGLIHLAFFEGFSHLEIAGQTGLPLGTVKIRIRMALQS